MNLNCLKCCDAGVQEASKGTKQQDGFRDTSIRFMQAVSVLGSSFLELLSSMAGTKGQEAPRHCCTLYVCCRLAQNTKTCVASTLLKLPP